MKITTTIVAAAGLAAAGALGGIATASAENAPDVTTAEIGEQAKLENGNVVQGWTISELQPSSDAIPYEVRGTLWEATATDEAIQGTVIPIVSNLNARAADGQTYRALFQVATPQGVNPETLAQGETTTGKVYFDVTGQEPNSVVYNAGGQDLVVWVEPAESESTGGSSSSSAAQTGTRPAPAAAEATDGEDTSAEDDATEGADGAATDAEDSAADGAEVPAGSQGTPLPAGSQGTPLPADAQVPEGAPAEAPAEAPAQAPEGAEDAVVPPADGTPAATPVPAGSQGTPLPDAAARPAGQGTPMPNAPHGPAPSAHGAQSAPASVATGESPDAEVVAPTTTPVPAP